MELFYFMVCTQAKDLISSSTTGIIKHCKDNIICTSSQYTQPRRVDVCVLFYKANFSLSSSCLPVAWLKSDEVTKDTYLFPPPTKPQACVGRGRKEGERLLRVDEYWKDLGLSLLKLDYLSLLVQPVVWLTDSRAGVQTQQPLWGKIYHGL